MNKNHRKDSCTSVQKIDINALYNSLRANISNRNQLQEKMRNLWSVIKKTKSNHSSEMKLISDKIGNATHKINQLISQLCQYKKTHKAMNIAYGFLKTEIERIDNIIRRKENDIKMVEMGKRNWIDDTGDVHADSSNIRNYVKQKSAQRSKLQNWLNYVSRYLVR